MDAFSPLPFVVHVDDANDPVDVLDALILGPFVAGSQPHARTVRLNRVRPGASLLPPAVDANRVAVDGSRRAHLATGDGWTLRAVRWADASAQVTVTALTEHLARRILRQATADAVEPARPADEAVAVGFWHLGGRGPVRKEREVGVAAWTEVRRNYAGAAARSLERLMSVGSEGVRGRLLLLHGPPGTGKTTALRALAHAWRRWCRVDYVLDPEQLFANPGYLMAAALGEDGEDLRDRWRLLVLEDCDELLRADAKQGSGQALSRLLNLTDGLLGQGLDVLVALTTNEPLGRLHPAIVRPGRCLARIEVTRLSRPEALAWLGAPLPVGADGATLAELYALRGDLATIGDTDEPALVGLYL